MRRRILQDTNNRFMENKEPKKIILGFLFYCPFFGTEYLIGLYYRRKFLEGLEVNGMLVVASSEVNKKQRVYHRCGCMYARRIKPDNRLELSEEKALRKDRARCMNIEVNFFNDNGSKPEEIINSYIQRQEALGEVGISFCLLTDGKCWRGTTNQLRVGFNGLKYLMNFNLAKMGMLEEAIQQVFC